MATSVVLVAFHGDRWLPACVESLARASTRPVHLVLVDNSGNTILDHLPVDSFDLELISTPRPMGFAEANNFALTTARHLAPNILFLNQDTISYDGWIDRCLDVLEARSELGAVSPFIRTYDGTGWDPSFLACVGNESLWGDDRLLVREIAPAPALIIRRTVLRKVGPFDPVFGSYYEDYDLCRRVRSAGYQIGFVRDAELAHFSGSTTDTDEKRRKRARLILRNRTLYNFRRWGGSRSRALLHHATKDLPRRLVRGALRTPSSQPPLTVLQAQLDLLKLGRRLFSRRSDEAAWKEYLELLGWPDRIPGLGASSVVTESDVAKEA